MRRKCVRNVGSKFPWNGTFAPDVERNFQKTAGMRKMIEPEQYKKAKLCQETYYHVDGVEVPVEKICDCSMCKKGYACENWTPI